MSHKFGYYDGWPGTYWLDEIDKLRKTLETEETSKEVKEKIEKYLNQTPKELIENSQKVEELSQYTRRIISNIDSNLNFFNSFSLSDEERIELQKLKICLENFIAKEYVSKIALNRALIWNKI